MSRTSNKYKAVLGVLPRRFELSQWTEAHFLQFFELVSYFMVGSNLRYPAPKILLLEKELLEAPPSFKQEVLYRINQFSTDPDANHRKFSLRFHSFLRLIGRFLKQNPALVTEAMRAVMEPNPRLNWILVQFKDYETKTGVTIPMPDTLDKTNPGQTIQTPRNDTIPTKVMNIMAELVNKLELVSASIKKSDLAQLGAKEKFQVLKLGVDTVAQIIKTGQGKNQMLLNININQSSARELEDDLLNFHRAQ